VSAAAPSRIPVEERLFSLVLALLATEAGLTKNEILSTVQGYRQRYSVSGDNANLERQFERDKDDIRELGVPLETLDAPGQAGNNQNLRYRIPRGDYELPADISFSPEETTLLNLAAMVWREGSISGESRRAILKLRSLGVVTDEPVIGYAPRLRVRDVAFEPLTAALDKHVVVRFGYLKPGEQEARVRTVAPIALIQREGRWMLHAQDQDAGGTRNFLLRRIVTPITTTNTRYTAFPASATEAAKAELDQIWETRTARLWSSRAPTRPPGSASGPAPRRVVTPSPFTIRTSTCSPTNWPGTAPKSSSNHPRNCGRQCAAVSSERRTTMPEIPKPGAPGKAKPGTKPKAKQTSKAKAQPLQAQDKLTFLLSLVPYLMDHDRVSVAEAAAHFGMAKEQIREAVRLIGVSGIPGETAQYQHEDLFDISWDDLEDNDQIVLTHRVAIDDSPRFSAREAAALIAGLQYLSSLPEHAEPHRHLPASWPSCRAAHPRPPAS
jgi:predicted DNA-binding transcriptional regulator YafY